jgi:hypothetical protein
MTPAHTRKDGKLYRCYVSTDVLKRAADAGPVRRIPAAEIESAVIEQIRAVPVAVLCGRERLPKCIRGCACSIATTVNITTS